MTTLASPAAPARIASATLCRRLAIMRVMAPMPDQADFVLALHVLHEFVTSVMGWALPSISRTSWLGGCERLQEEHPQVRHEVPGDAVVGIVK
jgi:hypothetical protein